MVAEFRWIYRDFMSSRYAATPKPLRQAEQVREVMRPANRLLCRSLYG